MDRKQLKTPLFLPSNGKKSRTEIINSVIRNFRMTAPHKTKKALIIFPATGKRSWRGSGQAQQKTRPALGDFNSWRRLADAAHVIL
ncbi:hypothetical protein ACI3PL_23420, partial [Lacticaseibacillus paracasei]